MRTLAKQILTALLVLTVFSTLVYADFYVIPVAQKMKNVVTVAKSGGQFTDVKAAIDSITDASADNPYLVCIGPGVYTVSSQIHLKAYVTVMGSGREATLLRGAISTESLDTSSIILGADNATLANLGVENTGGSTYSVGIYNNLDSPVLDDIAVTVSGGTANRALYNYSSSPTMCNVSATASGGTSSSSGISNYYSSPTMTNVTASASGGTDNHGIYNQSSSPTMTNVTAAGSGGTNSNHGISNYSSDPSMTNVTATGSGGTTSIGVYNSSSSPTMTNVTAAASGGTSINRGVHNSSSTPTIRDCTLKASDGTSYGVYGSSTIVHSTVVGGGGDSAVCHSCFDESGSALDATCN